MVEITYLAIAGIAIVAMFFGYGFGLFEGRSQGYKRRKADEEQERKDQPPPTPMTKVDDPGLLRIKAENGLLTLDLDGNRADTSSLSPEQRKRLIEMLTLMRPWLEGRSVPAPAPSTNTSAQLPSDQPVPAPVSPVPSTPKPTPQPVVSRASMIAKEDRPSAPANSIVAQIDAILQARLVGSPLADRGVFLTQSPEGGVNVFVGLTRYTG